MPLKLSPTQIAFNARGDSKFNKPFSEQVDFFRQKLNLPSEHYDDILKSAHDRAFIVAGAMKADLLNDFKNAIDKAAAGDITFSQWKSQFQQIVQKHGWEGWTGSDTQEGRDWRARVIYQTNMATSHAAGRYAQMDHPDVVKRRPYLKYLHSDNVLHPRPLHVSWSGLVLPRNDPWWEAHRPPNGYGCQCRVVPVTADEYEGAAAPDDGVWVKEDRTGQRHVIPNGIDYGFDYTPGSSRATPLADLIDKKLVRLEAPIGAAMMQALKPVVQAELERLFDEWVDEVVAAGVIRKSTMLAGWMAADVLAGLAEASTIPATAELYVEDRLLVGKKADRHTAAGDALTAEEWKAVPKLLADNPQVLLDQDTGKLLYVLPSLTDDRSIKIVIEMDYAVKPKMRLNLARSAFKINGNALLDRRRYRVIR
jgi:uncharacterized protein with gpF-like domain